MMIPILILCPVDTQASLLLVMSGADSSWRNCLDARSGCAGANTLSYSRQATQITCFAQIVSTVRVRQPTPELFFATISVIVIQFVAVSPPLWCYFKLI